MPGRAVVSFIFDDGFASVGTHIAPMFATKGLHCGFAINSRRLSGVGKCDVDRMLALQAEGFEICNHGATHKNLTSGDINPVVAAAEIRDGYADLTKMGFLVQTYIAANSVVHDSYIQYIQENHSSAYTVYKGTIAGPGAILRDIPQNAFKLHRTSLFSVGIAGAQATIDASIAEGGYICFYDHDPLLVGYERSMPLADLEKVLDYCLAKAVRVITPYRAVTEWQSGFELMQ